MIIIPMAGASSRFFKEGYDKPKYQLIANGSTLFEWSVKTFEKYFESEHFLFICRDIYETPEFIKEKLDVLGVVNYSIFVLERETLGQAETVYAALELVSPSESLLIFNIDTWRHNFVFGERSLDGYLEVFKGEGDHWSFVLPGDEPNIVKATTEKVRVSELCSNGIYFFRNKDIYSTAYFDMRKECQSELYIAPMYNYIINRGGDVKYKLVEYGDHTFMGTPKEYDDFARRGKPSLK